MGKRILVVGGGGREHAILWKLAQSSGVEKLFAAPGNGGTRQIAENVRIAVDDVVGLTGFAVKNNIDLTIVGPEKPLSLGIVDVFRSCGQPIFGPTRKASEIETSKAFAKRLMENARIPTACFKIFHEINTARSEIFMRSAPYVVKASGLAFGKGVYVCRSLEEAEKALKELLVERKYGDAGDVIIEDFLDGYEVSIHAFCDGKTFYLFPPSQDHKRVSNFDLGKNTGGMGVIAPLPQFKSKYRLAIMGGIIEPALSALAKYAEPFTGCLYPGLMMTKYGPVVLEFNARLGDPETEVYMRLLKSDFLDLVSACVDGNLGGINMEWNSGFAVCVILASEGYPDTPVTGKMIQGIEEAEQIPGVVVFHGATVFKEKLLTSGGRPLAVSAVGDTLEDAIKAVYDGVNCISFEGMHYRTDIGANAL